MNKAVAFTSDTVEEIAALANKAALECSGELLSLQVLPMTGPELDDVWFAAVALIRVPVVEAGRLVCAMAGCDLYALPDSAFCHLHDAEVRRELGVR